MNLGGLGQMMGAVPGGYQQGQIADNQIDQQHLQLADTRAKQIGMQAYYRALQGMMAPQGGQGPQPPMPGQPSTPSGPQMSPQAMPGPQMQGPQPPQMMAMNAGGQPQRGADGGMMPPDTQSAPAAMPQLATGATPQSPPGGTATPPSMPSGGQPQQQPGQMTWQQIVQAIKQQNPGVDDLSLAHAVDAFKPMMTLQAQSDWRNIRSQVLENIAGIKADAQLGSAGIRADATTEAATTRAGAAREAEQGKDRRFDTAETRRQAALDQRGEQFKAREDRLERGLALRSDTTYQRLEQQKQALEQRVMAGDKRQAVVELRAVIDAQHKLAMEKITATSVNNAMKPAERQQFIKDQNESYREQIEKLKNLSTQRGNITSEKEIPGSQTTTELPVKPAPSIAPAAPAVSAVGGGQPLPQAFQADPDGSKYQKDGKTWVKQGNQLVLENGG